MSAYTKDELLQRDKRTASRLWAHGLSTSAIAERLGKTTGTINAWLKGEGVKENGEPVRRRFDGTGCNELQVMQRVSPRIGSDNRGSDAG